TFKENCPDIRNSKVVDVINELKEFGIDIEVYDPWADKHEVNHEYGLELIDKAVLQNYQAVVLAVSHKEFKELNFTKDERQVLFDIKSFLDKSLIDGRL
ncbi:MAG: UDP binding domain-containing protein, partial [Nitrososphaeraceae archaeon]